MPNNTHLNSSDFKKAVRLCKHWVCEWICELNEGNGRSNSLKGNLFSPFNINAFPSVAALYNTEASFLFACAPENSQRVAVFHIPPSLLRLAGLRYPNMHAWNLD